MLFSATPLAAALAGLEPDAEVATMEADETDSYDQGDATGFIRLNALRLKTAARRDCQ